MTNLTKQQEKFVELYMSNGFDGFHAYKEAYENCDSDQAARVNACKALKNEKILEAIEVAEGDYKRIAREEGVDRKKVTERLAEIINGEKIILKKVKELDAKGKVILVEKEVRVKHDPKDIVSAINTLAKLIGDFSPELHKVTMDDQTAPDFSKMTVEEKEEYKKKLLANL